MIEIPEIEDKLFNEYNTDSLEKLLNLENTKIKHIKNSPTIRDIIYADNGDYIRQLALTKRAVDAIFEKFFDSISEYESFYKERCEYFWVIQDKNKTYYNLEIKINNIWEYKVIYQFEVIQHTRKQIQLYLKCTTKKKGTRDSYKTGSIWLSYGSPINEEPVVTLMRKIFKNFLIYLRRYVIIEEN